MLACFSLIYLCCNFFLQKSQMLFFGLDLNLLKRGFFPAHPLWIEARRRKLRRCEVQLQIQELVFLINEATLNYIHCETNFITKQIVLLSLHTLIMSEYRSHTYRSELGAFFPRSIISAFITSCLAGPSVEVLLTAAADKKKTQNSRAVYSEIRTGDVEHFRLI